jgi:hypothetical protein
MKRFLNAEFLRAGNPSSGEEMRIGLFEFSNFPRNGLREIDNSFPRRGLRARVAESLPFGITSSVLVIPSQTWAPW